MALLHYAGGDFDASLASALEMLAEEPTHILALNASAQACAALGRPDDAADYYRQVLDHLDSEVSRPLPEYQTHQRFFGVAQDPNTGDVTVVNSRGTFKLKLPVGAAAKPGEVFLGVT